MTREFPACHEAWANLGYALLMRYCDGLEVDDLRRFDLGQLAVGGFYRRPGTLEAQVRGIDEELWWDAVGALREALRLKPDSVVIKANLGVAYLVRPAGRDVGQAARYLQEAAEAVESDPANAGLNDLEKVDLRAAVLLNAGVADLAGGRSDVGARRLDRVAALGPQFSGDRPERPRASGLAAALHYNRALLLAASPEAEKRRAAVGQFERYLRSASPASAWWPLAYERYAKLCRELHLEAKSEKELKDRIQTDLRPLTAVRLRSGALVTLSEPMGEVTDRLGGGQAVPVVPGTNLRRLSYPDQGIDLLVTDRVLAIRLRGPGAPTLPLRSTGLGTTATELRVGMAKRELDQLLKDLDYSFAGLDDPEVRYRFYPELGLAVQVAERARGGTGGRAGPPARAVRQVVVRRAGVTLAISNWKGSAKMTRAIMGCVVAGLLTAATAGVLSITARAQNHPRPTAGADKSLEGLLKEVGIDYTRNQEGLFKIPIEIGGEATLIGAREVPLYKDRDWPGGQDRPALEHSGDVAGGVHSPPWRCCSGWPRSTTIWSSGTWV